MVCRLERYLTLPRSQLLDEFLDRQGDHVVEYDGESLLPREIELDEQPLDEYLGIAHRTEDLCSAQDAHAKQRLRALQLQGGAVSEEEYCKAVAEQKHTVVAYTTASAAVYGIGSLRRNPNLLRAVLHRHTVEEAERGICDAVLLSFIFGEDEEDKADIALLSKHLSETGSGLITFTSPTLQPVFSPEASHSQQYKDYSAEPNKMDCPTSRTETDNDSVTKHKPKASGELPRGQSLWIPRLVVENKKPSDKNRQRSLNQCRVYCVASVQFLASLGVYRHPVFGAAIDGRCCYVLMAWTDEKGVRTSLRISPQYLTFAQITFLFDRDVRKFDITVPIQALQYMTFLLRLKREADEQKAELTRKILAHFRAPPTQSATQQPRSWTKAAQTKEFPKFHTPPPPPPKKSNQPKNEVPFRKGTTGTV